MKEKIWLGLKKRKNDSEEIENGGKERKIIRKEIRKKTKKKTFLFHSFKKMFICVIILFSTNLYLFSFFLFSLCFLFSSSFFPAFFGSFFFLSFLSLFLSFFLFSCFLLKHAAILKERLAKHWGGSSIFIRGGGGQKVMCQHAHCERETEPTVGRGPGPAYKGPGEALGLF